MTRSQNASFRQTYESAQIICDRILWTARQVVADSSASAVRLTRPRESSPLLITFPLSSHKRHKIRIYAGSAYKRTPNFVPVRHEIGPLLLRRTGNTMCFSFFCAQRSVWHASLPRVKHKRGTRSCKSCHVQQDNTARLQSKRQAHLTTHNLSAAGVASTFMACAACKTRRTATSAIASVARSAYLRHSNQQAKGRGLRTERGLHLSARPMPARNPAPNPVTPVRLPRSLLEAKSVQT